MPDVLTHETAYAFPQGSVYQMACTPDCRVRYQIRDGMYATKQTLEPGDTFYKSLDEAKAALGQGRQGHRFKGNASGVDAAAVVSRAAVGGPARGREGTTAGPARPARGTARPGPTAVGESQAAAIVSRISSIDSSCPLLTRAMSTVDSEPHSKPARVWHCTPRD